ncbi:MAG: alpha/beta hydrolase [Pseudoruegeria sp.]
MRGLGKWLGRVLVAVFLLVAMLFLFGPYEPLPDRTHFDATRLEGGVDAYLAAEESGIKDLRPGIEKRVIWASEPDRRTPLSIVYIHGYSATSEEIRPVPDRVADALGANLYFTRLTGHGRNGEAMAEPTVSDWMEDIAEALAIGRDIGEEVIVLTTSTGGTFVALATFDPDMMARVKGVTFLSPNFGIANPLSFLLTFPAARYWIETVGGPTRSYEPKNDEHAAFWTSEYPTRSVLPMAAAVKKAAGMDYRGVSTAALFLYSPEDSVVRPDITADIAGQWGGPMHTVHLAPGLGGDPNHHVIAGRVVSPEGTEPAVAAILNWVKGLQ